MQKTELGALLIERGLLTGDQLEKALERQQNFGGRLGTCLLEIGVISESSLLTALSEQLGVPSASDLDLEGLSSDMVGLLPKFTALGCSAVPFRQSSDRVDVALLDPGDLALEDELSFSMGRRIRPHIANELRIIQALHEHYGGKIPLRFHTLLEQLDFAASSAKAEGQASLSPVPAHLRPGAQSPPSRKPEFAPPHFEKQAIQLTPEERAALEATQNPVLHPAPSAAGGAQDDPLGQWLSLAETASQIGEALIQSLAEHYPRVLLFRVSSGREEVGGWMSHGPDIDMEWFRHYSVGLHQSTVFRELAEGATLFAGRLESTPAHQALARCWGGSLALEVLFIPVRVQRRLVSVVCVDRGSVGLENINLERLRKVGEMTALAFERCILRRKLQTT